MYRPKSAFFLHFYSKSVPLKRTRKQAQFSHLVVEHNKATAIPRESAPFLVCRTKQRLASEIRNNGPSLSPKLYDLMPKNWCNQSDGAWMKKWMITQANENLSSVHCGQLKLHKTMFDPTRNQRNEYNCIYLASELTDAEKRIPAHQRREKPQRKKGKA